MNGRPKRRNIAEFSNCSGVALTLPQKTLHIQNEKTGYSTAGCLAWTPRYNILRLLYKLVKDGNKKSLWRYLRVTDSVTLMIFAGKENIKPYIEYNHVCLYDEQRSSSTGDREFNEKLEMIGDVGSYRKVHL